MKMPTFPAKGTPMFYLLIFIIIIIIIAIFTYLVMNTGTFDFAKVIGSKVTISQKPYGAFVTVGDKTTLEDISDTGFSLKHKGDTIIIHGKQNAPITFRRQDRVNGTITSDKTITTKSDYNLENMESGTDNIDFQIDFITLPSGV